MGYISSFFFSNFESEHLDVWMTDDLSEVDLDFNFYSFFFFLMGLGGRQCLPRES